MPKKTKGDNTNKPNVLGEPKLIPAQKVNLEIERLDQLVENDIKNMEAFQKQYNNAEIRVFTHKEAIKILQNLFLDDGDNQTKS